MSAAVSACSLRSYWRHTSTKASGSVCSRSACAATHACKCSGAVASASEAGLSRKLREAQRAAEEGQRMADRWKAERNEALGLRAASEAAAAAYQVID